MQRNHQKGVMFSSQKGQELALVQNLQSERTIDPLVADFCEVWTRIHEHIGTLRVRKISKTTEIAKLFKEEVTLPFYHKYRSSPLVEYSPAWMKTLGAFSFHWKGGRILFPLRLITYELAYYQVSVLGTFLDGLRTGTIPGTSESLFAWLFPKLVSMALPLSLSDLVLLRGFQQVYQHSQTALRRIPTREYVTHIRDLAPETLRNKIEHFRYFQMAIPMKFLDMGRLGYETYLISHFLPLPLRFHPYCLTSVNFGSLCLSLLQLPVHSSRWFLALKDFLFQNSSQNSSNNSSPHFCLSMKQRVYNWNLASLRSGLNQWQLPLVFFHNDPQITLPDFPPTMAVSLDPTFDPFRLLTPADLKLLTFLTTVGEIYHINDLSAQVALHRNTVDRLLHEYQKEKLLSRVVHFFNLGLELSVHLYINVPHSCAYISFLAQAQTLPWIDIYKSDTDTATVYFGRLNIPQTWTVAFVSRMNLLREVFPSIKLLYSFDPHQYAKWNLSLLETYNK
ncbi:MAG: hypothetical protein ACW98F_11040 [Candidatus Hodarchaeales archaeon]|jgi:hypothetical protein